MKPLPFYAALLLTLGSSAPAWGAPPSTAAPQEVAHLAGELSALEGLLGHWAVDARWADGRTVFARAEYRAGIGGRFLEGRVFVSDDGEPLYQRYHSFYRWNAERGAPVATTFHADGSVKEQELELAGSVLVSEWSEGGALVRDETELTEEGTLLWSVFVTPAGSDRPTTLIEAEWHRVPAKLAIDTSRIRGAGLEVRHLVRETTIEAPVARVFAAWAEGEAFRAAYAPESAELAANIELAVGGRYEWLFDGETGSNGCQVLSFVPNRMISFTWNAPPSQPESRAERTWVVVEVEAVEAGTRVRLTHLGFGTEPHWDPTYAYFESAWTYVLAQFKSNLEAGAG